jgi:predicted ribosomally synthesized peptide with nif11-like leader
MDQSEREIKIFINILEKDKSMQMRVKESTSPNQIIQIAESTGINISIEELRYWSRELQAQYFPWSGHKDQRRRKFFQKS